VPLLPHLTLIPSTLPGRVGVAENRRSDTELAPVPAADTLRPRVGLAQLDDRLVVELVRVGGCADHAARMVARKKTANSSKPARSTSRLVPKLTSAPSPEPSQDPAIDDYLAKLNSSNHALLRDLRKTIHSLVPAVEECISYRIPAFRYQGRIIAGFAATSSGCSYYPFSGRTLKTLASEIQDFSQTKSALHFDKPLPAPLVRKLLKARMAEGKR
jgi:uncharacterized protein YdhG (YjbR/CyaY superfamily)